MLWPLLSLVFAAPAPEPSARPPKGPAPVVMICKADKDGRPFLQAFVSRLELKSKTVPTLKDGKAVDVVQNAWVYTTEQKQVYLDDKDAAVYGGDGKKVDPKNLRNWTGFAAVLLSVDGKEVDPFYLPLARWGTLIVVSAALAGDRIEDAFAPKRPPDAAPEMPHEEK